MRVPLPSTFPPRLWFYDLSVVHWTGMFRYLDATRMHVEIPHRVRSCRLYNVRKKIKMYPDNVTVLRSLRSRFLQIGFLFCTLRMCLLVRKIGLRYWILLTLHIWNRHNSKNTEIRSIKFCSYVLGMCNTLRVI